ncbi:hypothetical protein [uncultured Paraglaciecola sp.]|uniref:hypothetical protein n=1 Tax=uncultured Paraglaciecola sp. TaxID=1765024 RepID=UPI0026331BC5|nr:hypothetical protein [uncultured Paraglaciecola sp.]
MSLRQIASNSPEGSVAPGLHQEIIQGVGATYTLKAEESGSTCLFDSASGVVYTLPAPVVGMKFKFRVTVAVTSNAHKVITNAGTVFLLGGVIMGDVTVAQSGDYFEANGSTHVAISAGGSTTGGLLGEAYEVECISATQWVINGVCHGAGTLATPFATS